MSVCTQSISSSKGNVKLKFCIHSDGAELLAPSEYELTFSTSSSKGIFPEGTDEALAIVTDGLLYKYEGKFKNQSSQNTVRDTGKELANAFMYGAIAGLKNEYITTYSHKSTVHLPPEVIDRMVKAEKVEGKIGIVVFEIPKSAKAPLAQLLLKAQSLTTDPLKQAKDEVDDEPKTKDND